MIIIALWERFYIPFVTKKKVGKPICTLKNNSKVEKDNFAYTHLELRASLSKQYVF